MKTVIFKVFKNQNRIALATLCLGLVFFASCNNDDNEISASNISEEEAAETIGMAVLPETGGLIEQTTESVTFIEGNSSDYSKSLDVKNDYSCDQNYGTSFIRSFDNGVYSYNADYSWNWIVNCENGIVSSFNYDLNGTNAYNSPRMSSDDKITATIAVSGLDDTETEYTINQTHNRSGSQNSSVRNENSFTSSLSFHTTNLTMLKANHNITSGSMSVAFVGQTSNGNVYDYSGELVFHGNQTATLTMGSGNTYNFSW